MLQHAIIRSRVPQMTDASPSPKGFPLVHGRTDARTYSAFGQIYAEACKRPESYFQIDCSLLSFCGGNLSAALSVVHRQLADQGKGLVFNNMQPSVQSVLNDAGLFGPALQRQRPSVIPLTPFNAGESSRFDLFVRKGLEGKGLPKMSKGLEHEFFTGIHELFTNFEIHSQSARGAYVCGQLFPRLGRVELSLVDHGIGIPTKIIARGYAPTPHSAIAWAMTGTNTTREGDVPGGLGLKVLREFIALNQGELTIASHGGFWKEAGGQLDIRPLAHPFPGTAVTVVVNTKDARSYRLTKEINAGDIF